eukprot:4602629-Pyramimonas_sp.AAC.1
MGRQARGAAPDFDPAEPVQGLSPEGPGPPPARGWGRPGVGNPWGHQARLLRGPPAPWGWPVRAEHGARAGTVHAVPRAERRAMLHALRVGPRGPEVAFDHLSAVMGGVSRGRGLAAGAAQRASVWKRAFQLHRDGPERPTFRRTPARRA